MFLLLSAWAQDVPAPVEPAPVEVDPSPVEADPAPVEAPAPVVDRVAAEPSEDSPLKVGIGAFFNAGGAFMQQPKDRTVPGFAGELPYSGMAGFSPGAGARLDIRVLEIFGIEAQLIRAWDQAESKYTINETDVGFTIKQPAWHVPLHLHIGVPSPALHAYMFGGVAFVIPDDPRVPTPAGIPWNMEGRSKTWHMWSFGIGFEGRLPIEGVDLRIPLQIRGAATAPYSSIATERAEYSIADGVLTSMTYDLRWQYYASVNLGLSWFFPK